jgi:hypothetical protein
MHITILIGWVGMKNKSTTCSSSGQHVSQIGIPRIDTYCNLSSFEICFFKTVTVHLATNQGKGYLWQETTNQIVICLRTSPMPICKYMFIPLYIKHKIQKHQKRISHVYIYIHIHMYMYMHIYIYIYVYYKYKYAHHDVHTYAEVCLRM